MKANSPGAVTLRVTAFPDDLSIEPATPVDARHRAARKPDPVTVPPGYVPSERCQARISARLDEWFERVTTEDERESLKAL